MYSTINNFKLFRSIQILLRNIIELYVLCAYVLNISMTLSIYYYTFLNNCKFHLLKHIILKYNLKKKRLTVKVMFNKIPLTLELIVLSYNFNKTNTINKYVICKIQKNQAQILRIE
jgi:hypothetical protein